MSIGTKLKELRESNGLTQVQAAARVGMKQQAWRVYETDASMPGAKLIVKICDEYGVSADWLLGLDERGTSVNAGAGAAVAIGANARASVRGTSAAQGERSDCAGCPYKEKMKEFEAFFNATKKKGKKK